MADEIETPQGVTPAPDDFVPTKLDGLTENDGGIPEVLPPDVESEMREAAKAAGISVENDDSDEGASGPKGAAKETEETDGPSGATGPASTETEEGAASGPTGATEGASGAAGTEATGATGVTGTEERDADLKPNLNPNTHPKTKEVIESFKTKAVEARNERDRLAKELEEIKAKGAAGTVPENVTKELEELRNRVRELDITRDPSLKAKYDDKIAANVESVLKTLKENGLGEDAEGNEIPGFFDKLKAGGVNLKTILPYIKKLEEAGEIDTAEDLKDMLRSNQRLEKAKGEEIKDWTKNYAQRQQAVQAEQEKQVKEYQARIMKETDAEILSTLEAFPQLKRPPQVMPNDSPAVKKEKERVQAEYSEEYKRYQDAVTEAAKEHGTTFKAAAVGLLYKNHITPRLQKSLAEANERVKALEAELGKIKKAGSFKPSSTPTPAPTKKKEAPSGGGFDDGIESIAAAAKELGINTES